MSKGASRGVQFESLENRTFLSASSILDTGMALNANTKSTKGRENAFAHNSDKAKANSPVFQAMQPVPIVTDVKIGYDNLANTTLLSALASANPNGNPNAVTLGYRWLRNGSPISGATAATLDLTAVVGLAVNDNFAVQVTPTAGAVTGTAVTSQVVGIATVAPPTLKLPVVTSATITPNSATNATALTVNAVHSNPYGRTNTLSYQWLKNGAPIAGATSATLDLTTIAAVGDDITVQITPNDGTLQGATFTTQEATVTTTSPTTLALPVVTAVDITPDNASNVTFLTANVTSSNPYGRTNTFSYQWLQNGAPISGATSQTLNLALLTVAVGDTFEALVTPFDGTLTGQQFDSGEVVTIATSTPDPITLQP